MNSYAIAAFFAILAVSNASVLHGSTAEVLQGPSSRTTLVGPEGSVISSVAPGGQVITETHSGVAAYTAPVAYSSYAAPAVAAYAAPAYTAYAAPSVVSHTAYAAPVVSTYAAPAVSTYAAPAVTAYAAPAVVSSTAYGAGYYGGVYGAPLAYSGYAAAAPVVAAHGSVDTVVAGPSGTIATSRGLTTADVVGSRGVYAHGW